MGYAHWQTQLREHQLRHHIHGSHYQQNICSMLVLSTSHQYLGRGFIRLWTEMKIVQQSQWISLR